MISAIVLTKNRCQILQHCLNSLAWCDEIIVVDDNSTDGTKGIVARFKKTRHFLHSLENDFAQQHNFGLEKATGDWVLFVDDDEIVSQALANEIKSAVSSNKHFGYEIPRRDFFFGQFLKHGETSSAKFIRLARKDCGLWKRKVHEQWRVTGKIGNLTNPIDHFPHSSIHSFFSSINFYTTIDALELQKEGKQFSLARTMLNPIGKFIQNYILKLGFLDGIAGLIMATMMSLYSLIVRVKQYDISSSPRS